VPVNTRFKAGELNYCLSQSGVSTLIMVDRFLDKIDFVAMLRSIEPAIDSRLPGKALPHLQRLVVLGDNRPAAAVAFATLKSGETAATPRAGVQPNDIVIMQYTSGTTSFPKGVLLTHDNVLRNAANVARRIGVRPGDRYFSARPFYHVAGTTLSLLVALSAGACLLTMPSFDAGASLRIMEAERCTLVSGNDTMFLMMMSHPELAERRLSLRGGWAAAGPVVMRQVVERMGIKEICFAYGLSEASPNIVMSDCRDDVELRIAGLARPHDGVELRIVDPVSGRDLPADEVGEILVRGWSVMRGYHDKPAETAKAIDREGWLHTGDLASLTADGRLRFVGRVKDVFRVGGENVAPAEVEEVLHDHPAVAQAQVIGVPDARLGEVPAAYVRLRDGEAAAPEELIAWCRARCANFKVPRYVRVIASFDEIGMTGSSKVQKEKLRTFALADLGLQG
jgi:fatty-acyl-CoA synthase